MWNKTDRPLPHTSPLNKQVGLPYSLTLNSTMCWIVFEIKKYNMFAFSLIPQHWACWDGGGAWNFSSWKTRTSRYFVVNTMVADDLATQGVRVLAAMILTYFSWNIPASASDGLTHWGRDKMAAVLQTTLSNAFSWMKTLEFRLRFHRCLFLRVQLTIIQHWFR